jgi:hypothetical protein
MATTSSNSARSPPALHQLGAIDARLHPAVGLAAAAAGVGRVGLGSCSTTASSISRSIGLDK